MVDNSGGSHKVAVVAQVDRIIQQMKCTTNELFELSCPLQTVTLLFSLSRLIFKGASSLILSLELRNIFKGYAVKTQLFREENSAFEKN